MGSSRRSKGSAALQKNPPVSPSSSSIPIDNYEDGKNDVVFARALEEVEDSAYRISWDEIICLVAVASLALILSISTGFAARVSISIHYYEPQGVPSNPQLQGQAISLAPHQQHQRVTILDPFIDLQSTHRDSLDLGRVITVSESGQRSVLSVVKKSVPLGLDGESSANASGIGEEWHATESPRLEPPRIVWSEMARVEPKLCSDGLTYGYDRWSTFKDAVQEVNAISAERYLQWNAFFAVADESFSGTFDDDNLYYEEDAVLTICPGATLKARSGPVFLNAENVIIECEGCTIDVGGTHLSFGPHARNVHVRGVTFKGAQSSSLVFFHDGAEATFEACIWKDNNAATAKLGAVADVNSTSTLNFYRCHIVTMESGPSAAFASSLSLRS